MQFHNLIKESLMLRRVLVLFIAGMIILLYSMVFLGNYNVTITMAKPTVGYWHENLGARGGIHTEYTGETVPPRAESAR
jgi:hypothetical protein